jgi:AcrR family transcriptional regulator
MKTDINQRIAFSREKWLAMAIDAMAEQVKSKFSLDSLIAAMPVTKGSFYSHFRDRSDFLAALVEYWDRHHTKSVVAVLRSLPEGTSAQDRLWELMRVVHDMKFNRYEPLIRSLTREFPDIRDAVRVVDRRRIDTVRSLFREMGFEGDELEMRTLACVTVTSQDGNVFHDLPPEDYERQLKLRHAFFVRPGGSGSESE